MTYFANYPPPTNEIVENISKIMMRRPDFYVQVRHLMDSMGLYLPCSSTDAVTNHACQNIEIIDIDDKDEPVDDNDWTTRDICQVNSDWPKSKIKALIEEKCCQIVEDANLSRQNLTKKKRLEIRTNTATDSDHQISTNVQEDADVGEFGQLFPQHAPRDQCSESRDLVDDQVAFDFETAYSMEFIRKNRLHSKDMKKNELFCRNYVEGEPSVRLYVKNISKKCTVLELKRLFGGFVVDKNREDYRSNFDVRLMTRGKLRGQAFVFMCTLDAAKEALRQTNGFVFHEKPIIVAYARSQQKSKEIAA